MSKSRAVCCETAQKSPTRTRQDANESVGMLAGASVSASETNAMGNDIAEGIAGGIVRHEGPCRCTP